MKALNEKEAVLMHVKFAAYMMFLIVLTLFFVFSFLKTSEAEIAEINLKTGDCDKIYRVQRDVAAVVFVSFTSPSRMPCAAAVAQSMLGLGASTAAFDISLACSGYA